MKAVRGEELSLAVNNGVGKLADICEQVKNAGVNIRAINGYVVDAQAIFRLVTSDNTKAKQTLSSLGTVESKDVVIAEIPDKTGELFALAAKLKQAGIDLTHIYGTTSVPGSSAIIVFASNNNSKALEVIGK